MLLTKNFLVNSISSFHNSKRLKLDIKVFSLKRVFACDVANTTVTHFWSCGIFIDGIMVFLSYRMAGMWSKIQKGRHKKETKRTQQNVSKVDFSSCSFD